jgi:uncharacterized oxidoreductase
MKLSQKTILITGGSSGIGLELAKQLIAKDNTVIICARSLDKLTEAKNSLHTVHTFRCDLSVESERLKLVDWVATNHPQINVLINNAALVHKTDFFSDNHMLEKADLEIQTNLVAPIVLAKLFLPLFQKQKQSAIINITTGLIYSPRAVYPIYNATKAALHSFTQVLREQIKNLPVTVIEVMMPVVATPWHKGNVPKIAILPERAVIEMVEKIEKDEKEIRIAGVRILYLLSRIAPAFAFKKINQIS